MKGTNPLPPGTQNVAVNMPRALANSLAELAKRSGVSRNKYCSRVLKDAADKGLLVHESSSLISGRREQTTTPDTEHRTAAVDELRKRFKMKK
jgi:hypothetical protein